MTTLSHRARIGAWVASGVLGGAVIAGVVVSQLGVATAASPSPRPSAPSGPFAHLRGLHGHMGMLGRLGDRVLHGEATIRGADGKDKVVEFQHGTISAINGSTVTVKSADGFTADYTVDKTTRIVLNGTDGALSTLKTNDDVRVMAVKSGSTATAKALIDGVGPMRELRSGRMGPGAGDPALMPDVLPGMMQAA